MALTPKDVDGPDVVFGQIKGLLPPWDEIPAEFKNFNTKNKWVQVVRDWFYRGLKNAKWTPKSGIDTQKAMRHVKACMASWEPQHEHKAAGCAYLLSEFFEDVTYTAGKLPIET